MASARGEPWGAPVTLLPLCWTPSSATAKSFLSGASVALSVKWGGQDRDTLLGTGGLTPDEYWGTSSVVSAAGMHRLGFWGAERWCGGDWGEGGGHCRARLPFPCPLIPRNPAPPARALGMGLCLCFYDFFSWGNVTSSPGRDWHCPRGGLHRAGRKTQVGCTQEGTAAGSRMLGDGVGDLSTDTRASGSETT